MIKTCLIIITISQGWTSHYSPNVMNQVIENRVKWGQLVNLDYDGYTAVPECNRIGDTILVKALDEWEHLLITDCARTPGTDGAYEWMTENNIPIEVDFDTAERWGAIGGGKKVEIGKGVLTCSN